MRKNIYKASMSHLPNDNIHFVENVIIRIFNNIYEDTLYLEDCYIPGIGTIDYVSIDNDQLEVIDMDKQYVMLSDLKNKDWDILFYAVRDAAQKESGMNRNMFLEMCDDIYDEEKQKMENDEYLMTENKQLLYEKIMRNVSKEVKRALFENNISMEDTHFIENAIVRIMSELSIPSIYLNNFRVEQGIIEEVSVIGDRLELTKPSGKPILIDDLTDDELDDLFYAVRNSLYDITDKTEQEINLYSIGVYFDEKKKWKNKI